jgi:molybdopterin/thiamine biosynthesis adenylyltransferase
LARRLIKAVAPEAKVDILEKHLQAPGVLGTLKSADVLIGCVDNDGARLILNELALSYGMPYFDLGVGIEVDDGRVTAVGGRLAVVLPGGPCMYCMNQIDPDEARYWLSTEAQREFMRRNGYVTGVNVRAPSVVALNASLAAAAVNELAVYISGLRHVNPLTEYDLLGSGRAVKGQWFTPVKVERRTGCPACENGGAADETSCEARYEKK